MGISPSASSHLRSFYCRFTTAKSVFIFLALPITEGPLKYSSVMYHCSPFFQHILHTLSVAPLSIAPVVRPLHPKCYTTMTIAADVLGLCMQNRTVYTSCNRISCGAGTLSRSQKASATTKDAVLSPPEDAAPSHCCEEVVSFFFLIHIYVFVVSSRERQRVEG